MKSAEAFGHCAICVEHTVQPYRKSVTPERCAYCQADRRGRAEERARILELVSALQIPAARATLSTAWLKQQMIELIQGGAA